MNGYLEDMQFEMGVGTELQNALAISRQEWKRVNDLPEIVAALACGKVVLVREWTSYCPRTDAIMGGNIELVEVYEPDQALPVLDFDEDNEVALYYKHPNFGHPEPIEPIAEDDIPF